MYRAGLIAVRETTRAERRPECTVYEITDDGAATFQQWIVQTLATPAREYPILPAVLSEVALLTPEKVRRPLEQRAAALVAKLGQIDRDLADATALPRVLLLENEYDRAVTHAELTWIQAVIRDLETGRLTWSPDELRALGATEPTSA